jgi:putative Holliday junction resolvase
VQEFISALTRALGEVVKFHEQDERFTTAEAQRVLINADMSRAKRKTVIDQQAAALFVICWLDLQQRQM